MKKIFLVLGTNVTLLFTATAKGDFQTVQKSAEGKITLKNIKQNNTTPGTEQFIRNMDVTYKVTGNGNTTTGQGYTLAAVKGDTTLPAANRTYMLIKITTIDWNTAALTAQLCDENGQLFGGVAAQNSAEPGSDSHVFIEQLKQNKKLEGSTSVTADDLHQAYVGSRTINEAQMVLNSGERLNVPLTDVNFNNNYTAKVGGQHTITFKAGDELMWFEANYNEAAAEVGSDVGQQQPAI